MSLGKGWWDSGLLVGRAELIHSFTRSTQSPLIHFPDIPEVACIGSVPERQNAQPLPSRAVK